jgi:hypothetical protein
MIDTSSVASLERSVEELYRRESGHNDVLITQAEMLAIIEADSDGIPTFGFLDEETLAVGALYGRRVSIEGDHYLWDLATAPIARAPKGARLRWTDGEGYRLSIVGELDLVYDTFHLKWHLIILGLTIDRAAELIYNVRCLNPGRWRLVPLPVQKELGRSW